MLMPCAFRQYLAMIRLGMTEPIWNDEGLQMVVVRNQPLRAKCGFPWGWAEAFGTQAAGQLQL